MSKKQSGSSKSSSVGSDVWNSDAPAHNCNENLRWTSRSWLAGEPEDSYHVHYQCQICGRPFSQWERCR